MIITLKQKIYYTPKLYVNLRDLSCKLQFSIADSVMVYPTFNPLWFPYRHLFFLHIKKRLFTTVSCKLQNLYWKYKIESTKLRPLNWFFMMRLNSRTQFAKNEHCTLNSIHDEYYYKVGFKLHPEHIYIKRLHCFV